MIKDDQIRVGSDNFRHYRGLISGSSYVRASITLAKVCSKIDHKNRSFRIFIAAQKP